jgi:hypothetical protein
MIAISGRVDPVGTTWSLLEAELCINFWAPQFLMSHGFSPYFNKSMFTVQNFLLVQKLVFWPNSLELVYLLS